MFSYDCVLTKPDYCKVSGAPQNLVVTVSLFKESSRVCWWQRKWMSEFLAIPWQVAAKGWEDFWIFFPLSFQPGMGTAGWVCDLAPDGVGWGTCPPPLLPDQNKSPSPYIFLCRSVTQRHRWGGDSFWGGDSPRCLSTYSCTSLQEFLSGRRGGFTREWGRRQKLALHISSNQCTSLLCHGTLHNFF